jgi:hypothetical protein
VPAPPLAAGATSACRPWDWRQGARGPTGSPAKHHAGFGTGGTPMPALAQAARATCRLPRRAATESWSFLAKKFTGGPFRHFVGAGGPMCQKFHNRSRNHRTRILFLLLVLLHHSMTRSA